MTTEEKVTSVYIFVHDPHAPAREIAYHVDTVKTTIIDGERYEKPCQYNAAEAEARGFTPAAIVADFNVAVAAERDRIKAELEIASAERDELRTKLERLEKAVTGVFGAQSVRYVEQQPELSGAVDANGTPE